VKAAEFLGAERLECAEPGDDGSWRFAIGRELHGAFGGAFGGVVAAAAIMTARSVSDGRRPAALDIRFLRSLPAGTAVATPTVLHAGRTLACVSVDLSTEDGRLAARAMVSLVTDEALAPVDGGDDERRLPAYDDGRSWPRVGAPIIETLVPRTVPWPDRGDAVALRVPWDDIEQTSAEAICLPGDMCVGPPVVFAPEAAGLAHPNPDLSLRFAAPVTSHEVIGVGRLERVHGGLATVAIEVWSGTGLVGVGVSSSTLLTPK
jgi:acyl-coenzyme A thioesterase PaaI-like protein